MSDKLRVGLVGLGHNGLAFAHLYAKHPQCTLAALCDFSPHKVATAADALHVPGRFTGDEFYEQDLDLISIHTPDPCHAEPFVKALAAGKHVFVEKPMGNSRADLDAMTEAARQSRRKTMVGQILRFNPFFARVSELAASGALGHIFYMEADYIHDLRYQGSSDRYDPHLGMNWYLEKEIPLVGGGVHAFDLLRWFAGCEAVVAQGYSNRIAFPAMRHPDCQVALFQFESGAVAKVASAYAPVGPRPRFNRLAVYGTKGTVADGQLYLGEGHHYSQEDLTHLDVVGHPYEPEVNHFIECILEDRQPLVDAFEGANSAIGVICAAEAAETGTPVTIPHYRR